MKHKIIKIEEKHKKAIDLQLLKERKTERTVLRKGIIVTNRTERTVDESSQVTESSSSSNIEINQVKVNKAESAGSDPITALRQTDLRFEDLAELRESFAESALGGGPSKATDEAPILHLRRRHNNSCKRETKQRRSEKMNKRGEEREE